MPTRRPRIGLMLATVANLDTGQVEPARVITAAQRAEQAGFDGVYLGDHLVHRHPILESVVTLSMVAAATERVALGPCVMLFGLRHPVTLAKQLGTLAAFAPGRLRIGVGVGGEYPPEFEAMGVPLKQRGKRMESVLREVRDLLATDIAVRGVTTAPNAPEVPFLLAGWKEISLRRAAAYGHGWIGYLLGVDSFARRRALLREYRDELALAGAPFGTGMLIPVHVDPSPGASASGAASAASAAWARLTKAEAPLPERLFAAGSPDQVVEQLHRYWEAGCTEFMLGPAEQGDHYLEQVDLLAHHVLPKVAAFR